MNPTAERHLRALLATSTDLVWVLDASGVVLNVSHSVAEHLAIDPNGLQGTPFTSLLAGGGEEDVTTLIRQAHGGIDSSAQLAITAGDGQSVSLYLTAHASEPGDQVLFTAPAPPIRQDQLFRTLAEHIPGVTYLCRNDATYSMLYLSPSVGELTGRPAAAFLEGRTSFVDLYHPDDKGQVEAQATAAIELRCPFHLQYRLIHADGGVRHVDEFGQGVFGPNGELLYLQGTLFDLTEKVTAQRQRDAIEQRLVQAQKLESLGLLAAGVAHEFNNLLASMVGYVDLTAMKLPADHNVQPMLSKVLNAADRAAELTRQLQAYAGHAPAEPGVLDLSSRIADLHSLMTARLSRRVHLELDLEPMATVFGDSAQLAQVTMNLIDNASDAVSGGGAVSVRTRVGELSADDLEQPSMPAVPPPPGRYVVLEVSDTGHGMDRETLERAFEPFYSTHARRHGLGLSAVAGTVQGHGGAVWVDTVPGDGTTVRIALPWASANASSNRDEAHPDAAQGQQVLVVDDEEGVRTSMALILEHVGYTVHVAQDGSEGHARYLEVADDLALVVLDMNMPLLGGIEVYEAIRSRDPDLPILFTSGYTEADPRSLFPDDPHIGFLAKPFPAKRLTWQVGELIR